MSPRPPPDPRQAFPRGTIFWPPLGPELRVQLEYNGESVWKEPVTWPGTRKREMNTGFRKSNRG